MARCRRNVDNFLDACRRIGVDEVCNSNTFFSFLKRITITLKKNLHKRISRKERKKINFKRKIFVASCTNTHFFSH